MDSLLSVMWGHLDPELERFLVNGKEAEEITEHVSAKPNQGRGGLWRTSRNAESSCVANMNAEVGRGEPTDV